LFGQPIGIFVVAGTETWEYFSYYGLRTLLVLFLTKQLGYSPESASSIYGTFYALAYATPLLGGLLSDRYLGRKRTLIAGSLLMACGHFGLAFNAPLWPALAAIVLGSGMFLPTLPAAVNDLYDPNDSRRERGFTIYYLSVNLGAFISPFICGSLGERFGWNFGFIAAGIGMLIGLAVFVIGSPHLAPESTRLLPLKSRSENLAASLGSSGIGVTRMVWLLGTAMLGMIMLRAAYEQTGNTVAIFAADHVDRSLTLFGLHEVIPATWFQSLNPLIVLTLAPFLLLVWARWERRGLVLSESIKMAIGCIIIGLAYSGLAGATAFSGTEKTAWPVLMCFFVAFTFGEIWVLPIGVALVSRLAPAGYVAMVVAIWASSRSAGGLLSGYLGRFMPALGAPWFFLVCGLVSFLAGAIYLILNRKMQQRA
jgi:proton-dependent oligopeptide transporter, POT family